MGARHVASKLVTERCTCIVVHEICRNATGRIDLSGQLFAEARETHAMVEPGEPECDDQRPDQRDAGEPMLNPADR